MNVIAKLESLRRREHEATVELVRTLVECDRSGAHVDLGYSSIWDFLVRHLKYSNAAASRRHKAMKAARRDPRVLEMLAKHQTNLSVVALAESTMEKDETVLNEIAGKSQRQAEKVLARRNPQKRKPDRVRRIAVKPAPAPLLETTSAAEVEDRVHLSFSVKEATHEKIERARAILSRKLPKGATLEQMMDELLDCYLEKHGPKPARPVKRESQPRHIPAATRDEVFRRDEHRCTYVGPTGVRCGSTHDLEVDHVKPFALGGGKSPENLRLLCAKHNRRRAEKTFGRRAQPAAPTGSAAELSLEVAPRVEPINSR